MKDTHDNNRHIWLTAYVPVFLWIGVIFFLSSSSGSMSETSLFIEPLFKFLFPTISEETLLTCHRVIRKLAHVTEYAMLGFLACRALIASRNHLLTRNWGIWAVTLVAITAGLDEFNQSFDVLRTSSPVDVILDILGGTAAALVVQILRNRRSKPSL